MFDLWNILPFANFVLTALCFFVWRRADGGLDFFIWLFISLLLVANLAASVKVLINV